jgi:hypothetical protein
MDESVSTEGGEAAAQNFLPTEEFKRWQGMIEGNLSQMSANINLLTQRPQSQPQAQAAAPQRVAIPEPTDEEVEAAFQEGKGPAMMRRLAAIEAEKREQAMLTQHINPLREQGLSALNRLTKQNLRTKLKYFDKYEGEIQGYLDQLPPDMLSNEGVYEVAHAKVVADHLDEIIEERVRASMANEDPVGDPLSAIVRPNAGKQTNAEKVPSVEELCGSDAAQALKQRGQSPDHFARQLGYTDWAAYTKVAAGFEEK